MEVVDHEPSWWFLLREGDTLFLDVGCDHGAAGYTVVIRLDEHEAAQFELNGRPFLEEFARRIQDAGPWSASQRRSEHLEFGRETAEAIARWKSNKNA